MFSVPVDNRVPGFRVGEPEFVPGFRLSVDGSPLPDPPPFSTPQDPAGWTSAWARPLYVDARGDQPGFLERNVPSWSDVQDAADWLWPRMNAAVNGAYSIFPGTYDAARGLARGIGLLGPEEFRRIGQEADFAGDSVERIVRHPGAAHRAADNALTILAQNPLIFPYLAGRVAMGTFTGLGPAADMGGFLRALENGHDLIDAVIQHGVGGLPSTRP